jgi:WXG100 family type VII secretion target
MSIIGGDPEQLTALKTAFDRHGASVHELTAMIRSQLDGINWQGPHAERFRSSWRDEFEPVLRRLEEALREAGMEVGRAGDRLREAGGLRHM